MKEKERNQRPSMVHTKWIDIPDTDVIYRDSRVIANGCHVGVGSCTYGPEGVSDGIITIVDKDLDSHESKFHKHSNGFGFRAITEDHDGNVICAGYHLNPVEDDEMMTLVVAKYDSSLVREIGIKTIPIDFDMTITGVVVDSTNRIIICGDINDDYVDTTIVSVSPDLEDIHISKIDVLSMVRGIAVDDTDSVILCGWGIVDYNGVDHDVGTIVRTKYPYDSFESTNINIGNWSYFDDIAITPAGHFICAGQCTNPDTDMGDALVVEFDQKLEMVNQVILSIKNGDNAFGNILVYSDLLICSGSIEFDHRRPDDLIVTTLSADDLSVVAEYRRSFGDKDSYDSLMVDAMSLSINNDVIDVMCSCDSLDNLIHRIHLTAV